MINGGIVRCKLNKNHMQVQLSGMSVLFKLLFFFLFFNNLSCCLGLNSEGLALLRFKERVVRDPLNALSSWYGGGGDADPCSWFGVECSDGKVVALNLKDMCLRGTLPPELGKLTHVKFIILRNNSFFGTIPREIVELKDLKVLDLGYNNFIGPLPFEPGNNVSLEMLLLDNNRFLDGIFTEKNKFMLSEDQVDEHKPSVASARDTCGEKLVGWNMGPLVDFVQRSLLQATKGSSQENHTKKSSLAPISHRTKSSHSQQRLHHKQPTASPKRSPAPAPLLSPGSSPSPSPSPFPFHKFHPPSPAPASAITRKKGTASSSEETPPVAPPVSSPSASNLRQKVAKSHAVLIGVFVAGGFVVIIVSMAAIIVCQRSKMVTVKPWSTGLSGQLRKAFVSGVSKLNRSELETACEDFSNIIGTLADSAVYKGTLSNGVEIAVISSSVKSSEQWSKHLETQFRKKIETLSKVNHKNFVNLLGYCEEKKPFTRMMVFEYAPNGTLFEHLHIKEAERLDWRMRMRVIMGIAYCLVQMHELDPPIPHRDLQSSSVYLSEDYAAKVSDFSFWTATMTKKLRSPSMELFEASMTDIESNVHSFGLLLFEIVTGKIPYAPSNGAVEEWVWEYLSGDHLPRDAVDPMLDTFQEEEIQKLFEIIKDCVHPDPSQRPTMRDVASRLKEITGMGPDGAKPRLSPLWWAELDISISEAS